MTTTDHPGQQPPEWPPSADPARHAQPEQPQYAPPPYPGHDQASYASPAAQAQSLYPPSAFSGAMPPESGQLPYGAQPQVPYAPAGAAQPPYAAPPQMPYPPHAYYGGPAMTAPPFAGMEKSQRFGKLAWAALILGIVGVLGSFVPLLGFVTMFVAIIGGILGVIAVFGSKKVLAGISIALAVLAVVLTVTVTKAFVDAVSDTSGSTAVAADPGGGSTGQRTDAPSNVYKFGQTVKFSDGSTLRVDKPVTFTPDQFAITGDERPLYLKFKATFVNNTEQVYDPSLTSGSASADGEEGESVYQDGLDAPDNKILPGKSVTWWMGYGVQSRTDLQLEVRVGFLDHDTVIFTN